MVKRRKVLEYKKKIVCEKKGQQLALEREEKANQQMTAEDSAPGEMGGWRAHTGGVGAEPRYLREGIEGNPKGNGKTEGGGEQVVRAEQGTVSS